MTARICMGGMLQGGMITCTVWTAGCRTCDHENLCGLPGYYINKEILTQTERREGVSPKIRTLAPCAAEPSSTFTLPIHIFWVIKKRKEADYIFIYQQNAAQ